MALGPQTIIGDRRSAGFRLEESMRQLRESRRPVSLLLAEVDHPQSASELTAAAGLLRSAVRSGDFVAYWAGDILLCLLSDCRVKDAARIAERCLDHVSLSCGVTELRMAERATDAVERALQLVGKSKRLGRHCVSAG